MDKPTPAEARDFAIRSIADEVERFRQSRAVEDGRSLLRWLAVVAMANPEVLNGKV